MSRANHRETVVFNQCSNLLLQHAIDTHDGKKPEPLRSLHDGKTALPPMPRPGDVDFVYGGVSEFHLFGISLSQWASV